MPKYLKDGEDFSFPKEFGFHGSAKGQQRPRSHGQMEDEYGDHLAKGGDVVMTVHHHEDGSRTVHHADGTVERHDSSEYAHRSHFDQGGAVGGPPPGGAPMGPPPGGGMPGGPRPGMGMSPPGGAPPGSPHTVGGDKEPTISMPMSTAAKMAQGIMANGAKQGARAAVGQMVSGMRGQRPGGPPQQGGAPGGPPMMQRPPAPPAGGPPSGAPAMAHGGHFIQDAIKHPGRMQHGATREGVSTHQYMEEHKHDPDGLGNAARLGLRMTGGDLKPHHHKKG